MALSTTATTLHVNDDVATETSSDASLKLTASGEASDAYVTISAPGDSDHKVNIAHALCLPRIECTVQPYTVRAHLLFPAVPSANPPIPAKWQDKSPETVPSAADLEASLNAIYEKQMNVHFTVNPIIELGTNGHPPVYYDVGVSGHSGTENNLGLDVFGTAPTEEENILYTAGYTSNVINVYYLPNRIGSDYRTVGISRLRSKVALIANKMAFPLTGGPNAVQKAKDEMMQCVAHEIGHLGMGAGGENAIICLAHSRENHELDSPDSDGFPLRRKSDDMRRLMWWEGAANRKLLIKDEWLKFRESKQQ